MVLSPGARLGVYEIVTPLGAGGMGEVYRARDTRLGRDVAIKILPPDVAADPERLVRFEREAQVLAALNHHNIAHIHGVEDSTGTLALVMELVEGATLADRIVKGPIPVDESLDIARQIAEGIEAAHAQGIIHRDLKPANIKVRPDRVVKILDFGLAKALAPDAGRAAAEQSRAATITTPAATRLGVVMGTAAYMSPEQARGQTVDEQTDIWAFGVVLYEMVTGKQAFGGETVTDVIARIVTADPDWTALPDSTPPLVSLLLRQCLQRKRTDRLRHIGDARIQIDAALSDSSFVSTTAPARRERRPRPLAWMAGAVGLLAIGAAAGLLVARFGKPAPNVSVVRLPVHPPPKTTFSGGPNTPYVSLSPDGRHLAFLASSDGLSRVWVRSLDSLDARPLAGTDGVAFFPAFWSPDSRSIAFFTVAGKMRRVDLGGGPVQTICDAPQTNNPSGTWNRDGVIIFGGGAAPLKRVSAAGGTPEPVTTLDQSRHEQSHQWPTFLPDGDHFLFLARSTNTENNAIFIGSLRSRETRRVMIADSRIAYDPAGYLLFVRDGSLLAVRFDERRLSTAGDPFLVAERVRSNGSGQSTVTVSANGVLAYRTGDLRVSTLTWFDRSGKALGTLGPSGVYQNPELSPDERRVAIVRSDATNLSGDIWIIDVARAVPTRLTFGAGGFAHALWSPDGERVAVRYENETVATRSASGAGGEQRLFNTPGTIHDWSPDGTFIVTSQRNGGLVIMPLSADRKPFSYLSEARFNLGQPQISFDGRWIAYRSNESGRNEVYIQSFPDASVKARVSTDGGDSPRWRRDGKELFYLAPDQKLMVVSVATSVKGLEVSRPAPLFEMIVSAGPHPQYDVTGDGQRFLVNSIAAESETPVTVVLNWSAGLKN